MALMCKKNHFQRQVSQNVGMEAQYSLFNSSVIFYIRAKFKKTAVVYIFLLCLYGFYRSELFCREKSLAIVLLLRYGTVEKLHSIIILR